MKKRSVLVLIAIVIALPISLVIVGKNQGLGSALAGVTFGLWFALMGMHLQILVGVRGEAIDIKALEYDNTDYPLKTIGFLTDKYLVVVDVLKWNRCLYFEVPTSWVRNIYVPADGNEKIRVTNSHGNTYVYLFLKRSTIDSLGFLPVQRDLIQVA